jgi:hypothetical protein
VRSFERSICGSRLSLRDPPGPPGSRLPVRVPLRTVEGRGQAGEHPVARIPTTLDQPYRRNRTVGETGQCFLGQPQLHSPGLCFRTPIEVTTSVITHDPIIGPGRRRSPRGSPISADGVPKHRPGDG